MEHSTSPSLKINSANRNLPTCHTLPYLSNQTIEVVAWLSRASSRQRWGQSESVQEIGLHQETLACKLSSGNQSLNEQSPRVHLCTSGWMATSPNSEVPTTSQAHSTPSPWYSHGKGESSSLILPPYEDSLIVQVTATTNPSPSSRSEVSLLGHSLYNSDCRFWSHLHCQ